MLGSQIPYITLFGAVIVAAWYGGVAPAVLAALVGFVGVQLVFVVDFSAAHLALYALSTGLIAALGGVMHRTQARAQASDERLRKFIENAPVNVFIKDAKGRYLFMNAAGENTVGRRDWQGRTDEELLPAEAARQIIEHDREVQAAGTPVSFSLTLPHNSGVRHLYSTKFPLPDPQGELGIASFTIDVTDQQRHADELRLVLDTLPAGVVRCSREMRYVWVNRAFAARQGRTPEEIVGRPIAELIGPEGMEAVRPNFERVLAGERVEYERLAAVAGREPRWIHAVAAPTFDAAGRPDGWVGVVTDVHERKQAREQLQLVADSMPAAVALCSRDLRYVWVNRRCAEWLGSTPEALAGRPLLEVIGAENLTAIQPYIDRVLAGEHVQYERLVHYPGMGSRWMRNFFSPARGGEEWVTVISDIHDRKLMEEALRDADRRKDEFLATLAHELRNPLAPIRNAVALLKAKAAPDPELAWSGEVIGRQVDQLARLIDDLLDIARIASGKLRIRKERVALERVLDLALETSRPHLEGAGHTLKLACAGGLWVDADPTRLAQVFANLLNNAARYTDDRGEIVLAAVEQGAEVAISVHDNGIGFPPEVAARLFEPFSQLTSAHERAQGGLGIGLALVRGIVALHGGRAQAHSAGPGSGSTFTVHLPLAQSAPAEEVQAGEKQAGENQTVETMSAQGLRVLIADDNRDAADSLARILAIYGHEVKVVYDGPAALAAAADFLPHAAVLDIGMPGMSGLELARALRQCYGSETRLVALTGWGQEGDRRRALEAGFDHHLTKPVDPRVLHAALCEADAPTAMRGESS